jgi:CubicO group peptidase (beta-lactamase class C family)
MPDKTVPGRNMADRLTAAGIGQLRDTVARHVAPDRVPGLVALVASGGQVHVETAGALTVAGPPAQRDSLFRIASTTKPVTGAAVMALIEEGLLGLDDPVATLLPELASPRVLRRMDGPLEDTVPAERPITTRDLLTFTFGFGMVPEMFAGPAAWPVQVADGELGLGTLGAPDPAAKPDPDTWMARFGTLPLLTQPGERWMYNAGAHVLGVLASRAAGQSLGEVLASRVFGPLGMTDTGFWTGEPARLATAYRAGPAGPVVVDPPDGDWARPPVFEDGAAGLVSTVDDLYKFARMFTGGGAPVLAPESVAAMTMDQLKPGQKSHGGLFPGFFDHQSWSFCQAVRDDGAFGWDGGYGTSWLVDPARDLIVIALTQRLFDTPQLPEAHRDIQAAAYAALAAR